MSNKIVRRNISQKSELISDLHTYNIIPDSRELYIHGVFNDDAEPGVDYRMCSQFIKNINFLCHTSKTEPILIHSITCGGDWQYGMAMYDAIKSCPCPVTILAYAHARSMSSIILQAATYRVMMPNSVFMIHEGTMGVEDNTTYKAFQTCAEEGRKATETMLDIYVEKVKQGEEWGEKSETWIRKALHQRMDSKQDWFLSAKEAVRYGFADAVLGDEGYENIETLLTHVE